MQSPHFAPLAEEFDFLGRERARWEAAPYPPVFVTTDAVLVHSGHLLLVRRGHHPGKDLWALPGGFVDQEETIYESCLRELREETGLEIPAPALRAALERQRVFNAPHRSQRAAPSRTPSSSTSQASCHHPGRRRAAGRWFRLAACLDAVADVRGPLPHRRLVPRRAVLRPLKANCQGVLKNSEKQNRGPAEACPGAGDFVWFSWGLCVLATTLW
jgi:ADP-ribose pyrophosphatase YjhB (NUDIX family)